MASVWQVHAEENIYRRCPFTLLTMGSGWIELGTVIEQRYAGVICKQIPWFEALRQSTLLSGACIDQVNGSDQYDQVNQRQR